MNDPRDRMSDLLLAAAPPEHLPGFDQDLETGLRKADLEMGRSRARLRPRRVLLAVAVTLAVCAVVAVVVLVGLPGASHVTGPEPVSAEQAIKKMLHALATARTLRAESTDSIRSITPTGDIQYVVNHRRVYWSSDGSTRFILLDEPQARPRRLRDRPDENDFAYDAADGVYYDYFRGWNSELGLDGGYENRFTVVRHYPIGPPDAPPSVSGFDFSSTARAQEVAREATVTMTTCDGRPAWMISISTLRLLGRAANEESLRRWLPPVSGEEVSRTTVDRQTGLPVRFQVFVGGVLQFEYRWSNIKVGAPLPSAAFTVRRPQGAKLVRVDAGYLRLPVARIAARTPGTTMVPDWLPLGFRKTASAFAPWSFVSTYTTTNSATYGRKVVALRYARGFDNLTVTTRIAGDPAHVMERDPVMDDTVWVDVVSKEHRLAGGWFSGSVARIVTGPRATTPHLWAVKDGVLLTVAGSVSAQELIAIAESMRSYGAGPGSK